MRVLVVPEFYRPDDPTANGTVNDAIEWIREWLDRDDGLHVYLLVPSAGDAGYDPSTLLGDRRRVTLIEADPPFPDLDGREPFTDTGYSTEQLRAIRRHVLEPGAYVDVVIDQLRCGRETLYKWLLEATDQWAAEVRPFDVIANVHDLQVPEKYRYASYRNAFQYRMEAAGAAFADGVWFTAGVDREGFRRQVDFLADDVVGETLDDAIVAGSPIAFDRFEERYADEPETLHVAGSFWAKKNVDRLVSVAETLHDRFDIETLLTSVEPIPERYRAPEWVEAHGEASRETYERALDRGDLTVHASDYETMARTPIEQAASGQVVLLRDTEWARECAPDDHPLLVPMADIEAGAIAAVEDWEGSVAATRRFVDHAREVRGATACGRRTYRDLRRRIVAKERAYGDGKRRDVVERAAADCGDGFALADVRERTAAFTEDGRPLPAQQDYAFVDLVYTLRVLGYRDVGNPGTPVFERTRSPVQSPGDQPSGQPADRPG